MVVQNPDEDLHNLYAFREQKFNENRIKWGPGNMYKILRQMVELARWRLNYYWQPLQNWQIPKNRDGVKVERLGAPWTYGTEPSWTNDSVHVITCA